VGDRGDFAHYQRHIIRDPKICGGEPVFKGTRVTLRTVLASLATATHSRRSWLIFLVSLSMTSEPQLHSRLPQLKRKCKSKHMVDTSNPQPMGWSATLSSSWYKR
jgi:Protein of unknown function (DUF433)